MVLRFKSVRFSHTDSAMAHHVYGLAYDDKVPADAYKMFHRDSVRDHELRLSFWQAYVSGRRIGETFAQFGWINLIAGIAFLWAILLVTGVVHANIAVPWWLLPAGALWLLIHFGFYLSRTRKALRERLDEKAAADRTDESDTSPIFCVREEQWEAFRKRHML